ncbi:hypothetical protein R6Q57_010278 [Mikania cordata]
MLEKTFLIDNAIKKFDSSVPIMPLVGSLAKSKFCNALEHPIGKFDFLDTMRPQQRGFEFDVSEVSTFHVI